MLSSSSSPPPPPRQLNAAFVSQGHQWAINATVVATPHTLLYVHTPALLGAALPVCLAEEALHYVEIEGGGITVQLYQHRRASGVMPEFNPGAPAFVRLILPRTRHKASPYHARSCGRTDSNYVDDTCILRPCDGSLA
ncbi:hypothetical protein BGW80DRAFT_1461358 [Lactifluus volemus]|nr:hypothetical protein BGW80DRAFT_1461358 [Lactifluus volemus]